MQQLARAWPMGGSCPHRPSRGSYASTAAMRVRVASMPPTTYRRPAVGLGLSVGARMRNPFQSRRPDSGAGSVVVTTELAACAAAAPMWGWLQSKSRT